MRPTWVSTMDAELFGGDEAPLRIVANSTLPPLPGFTPPARLVAVPVAPKPPPAPAPPVLKSGVNPFGKPPPAAPKSVTPDIATGPVIVFFNYHSVAAPVSNIQGIIDYVCPPPPLLFYPSLGRGDTRSDCVPRRLLLRRPLRTDGSYGFHQL